MNYKRIFSVAITLIIAILLVPMIALYVNQLTTEKTELLTVDFINNGIYYDDDMGGNYYRYLPNDDLYIRLYNLVGELDGINTITGVSSSNTNIVFDSIIFNDEYEGFYYYEIVLEDMFLDGLPFPQVVEPRIQIFEGGRLQFTETTGNSSYWVFDNMYISLITNVDSLIPPQLTGISATLLKLIPILFVLGSVITVAIVTKDFE